MGQYSWLPTVTIVESSLSLVLLISLSLEDCFFLLLGISDVLCSYWTTVEGEVNSVMPRVGEPFLLPALLAWG